MFSVNEKILSILGTKLQIELGDLRIDAILAVHATGWQRIYAVTQWKISTYVRSSSRAFWEFVPPLRCEILTIRHAIRKEIE